MSNPSESTVFLTLHFYRIMELKNKGYSWKEIITEINQTSTKRFEIQCGVKFSHIARKMGANTKYFSRYKQGIKEYVMKNIDRFRSMRACGFSWNEIIEKLYLHSRFPLSKDLRATLTRYFAEANRRNMRK